MSALAPCYEGITAETLSAWADGGLPDAEAARLASHTPTCPACQATLSAYQNLDTLLAGIRVPTAAPSDAAAFRAGRAAQPQVNAPARAGGWARSRTPRALWGGIGAAVAAALLIVAFAQVFTHLSRPTKPTATVQPTIPLAWSERTIPSGLTLNNGNNQLSFTFSPANNQDGWLCVGNTDGSLTIWATTDQARSWKIISNLGQAITTRNWTNCAVTPDSFNPRILALNFLRECISCGTVIPVSYISGDGGVSWRSWPNQASILALATLGPKTFVLQQGSIGGSALFVSDQSLTDWHSTGPQNPTTAFFYYLWPNFATGALLLSDGSNILWRSDDSGATWTQIALPAGFQINSGEGGWVAAQNAWRICGQIYTSSGESTPTLPNSSNSPPSTIHCTMNLGKTWTVAPELQESYLCSKCGSQNMQTNTCFPQAMAADGSLYTECSSDQLLAPNQPRTGALYRLRPGATTWQKLSEPPNSVSNPFTTPLPGTPIDSASQDIAQLIFSGDPSRYGSTVWYFRPHMGVFAVATLPTN